MDDYSFDDVWYKLWNLWKYGRDIVFSGNEIPC